MATTDPGSVARWVCKLCILKKVKKEVRSRMHERSYENLVVILKQILEENPRWKNVLQTAGLIFGDNLNKLAMHIF